MNDPRGLSAPAEGLGKGPASTGDASEGMAGDLRRRQEQLAVVGGRRRPQEVIGEIGAGDRQRESGDDEHELGARGELHGGSLRKLNTVHSTASVAARENHVSAYSRCFAIPASGVS